MPHKSVSAAHCAAAINRTSYHHPMKAIIRSIASTMVPLALLASGPLAHATATTSYTAGDLFLGFRQAGNNSDYLVNIGQASLYTGAASTITLSKGNIAADLSTVFGGGWDSDNTICWSVSGTTHISTVGNDPPRTIYASKMSAGSSTTPWTCAFSLSTADSKITSMATAYKSKASTTNSNYGIIQNNVSVSVNNAYASYQPGGVNVGAGNLS